MKRLLSLLLAIAMVMAMIPTAFAEAEPAAEEPQAEVTAPAEETVAVTEETAAPEQPADPIDQATYAATSGYYTYYVSGGKATINDYTGAGGDITIPATLGGYPVTTIGNEAFYDCDSLAGVTIGDSVTTIGEEAFYDCDNLTNVTIANSVTTIGYDAFERCGSLNYTIYDNAKYLGNPSNPYHYLAEATSISINSVVIHSNTRLIGDSAFYNCLSLTSITIPDSVISIHRSAFCGCDSLTNITIPDSVITIGDYAFSGCDSLTSVTIGNSVTTIGSYAFWSCGLTSVTIPDSVTTIGGYAFEQCYGMTSVTIGDSVTYIGPYAFWYCTSLKSVTIPDSVVSIYDCAFRNCSSLTSVTIGDGVTTIGSGAFLYCTRLDSITIGDSVTTIGSGAFDSCVSIEQVYITDVTAWCNISFTGSSSNPLRYRGSLYVNGALCTDLVIPDGVTTIGGWAFYECTSITSVTIPDSVTTIVYNAFYNCSSLTDVYYGGTEEQWNAISIGSSNAPLTSANIRYNHRLLRITNTAGNQHVIKNSPISFTVELNRTEGVTYQWQRCKSGNNWTNVSYAGNQTNTVTFSAASWAQYPFRCVITDANGTRIYTDTYTYTLIEPPIAPNITSNPKDDYVLAGGTAAFSVEAVGSELTYQWWRSKNGGETWGEYTGTGSTTSSISLKVYSGQEYLYMCEVKDGYGNTLKSKVVQPHLIKSVKITAQPTLTAENGAATITFTATGDVKTYQWQRLKSNGWADAVGANYIGYNTNTLTTTVKATWRCRIVDKAGNITYTNQVTFSG